MLNIQNLSPYFLLILLSFLGGKDLYAQSKAHQKSQFVVIDPAYSSTKSLPESKLQTNATTWIYGAAELETERLQLLMQRKDSAKLQVGYPGEYHQPFKNASFRLQLKKPFSTNTLQFRAIGTGKILVNGVFVGEFSEKDAFQSVVLKKKTAILQIQFDITTHQGIPALLIENPVLSTNLKTWEWKAAENAWEITTHFPQNTENLPPHLLENPSVKVPPLSKKGNLYDFGKELLGYIVIKSPTKPAITFGESETEALDTQNKNLEQTQEVVQESEGVWRSKVPLAFRYLHIENSSIDAISCQAIFHPSVYKGAFACSDTVLTKIWMNSAYTLRLCMQDFLLDGIKRDRLPWAGDLAMSILVNTYTFQDPELVRRSLVALGRAGIKQKDINGIVDYSLWWLISQDHYQQYFGDKTHLRQEWKRIKAALDVLSSRCDANGFLNDKNTWLFIDWVDQDKWTALQIMWWWAQNSSVKLAERMGDKEMAMYWKNSAEKLKANLEKRAWNETEKVWFSSSRDTAKAHTRHPNFLAVVSGITPVNQYEGIHKLLENPEISPVGTPYMAGFEMMARAQLGNIDFMLNHVKSYWGDMLNKGATTFWEAYDAKQSGKEQYAYYRRPYAKSLCHAWSAGPAAFLPAEIFGLKSLADGWQRFTLKPNLGTLKWANVCLPTQFGNITVDIEGQNIEIAFPKDTELIWKGKVLKGPMIVKEAL